MGTLADEFKTDLHSGELADLFEPVTWGRHSVEAMVAVTGVAEEFEMGGPTLSAVREFSFRLRDLLEIETDLAMFGDSITYAGRRYDVTEVRERPGWPLLSVSATLRN